MRTGSELLRSWPRAMRWIIACWAAGALVGGHALASPPRAGELLLLDRGLQLGPELGAILAVNLETGNSRPVAFPAEFSSPRGMTWEGAKTVYLGDGNHIWAVDSYTGPTSRPDSIGHAFFAAIVDLERDGSGGLYVLDQTSDPLGAGYSGAILHLDPTTRDVNLVASDESFVAPECIVREESGTLLVMDAFGRAEPGGPADGALFRVDPLSHATTVALSLAFAARPTAVVPISPDTVLIADADASIPGFPPAAGAIFMVSLSTHAVIDTLASADFRDPLDLVLMPGGMLAIVDGEASLSGAPGAKGAIFYVNPRTGEMLHVVSQSIYRQLRCAALFDGPDLDGSTVTLRELGNPPLRPGELLELRIDVACTGVVPAPQTSVTAELASLVCLFGTARADAGTLTLDPVTSTLHWRGDLELGDTVHIQVDVRTPDDAADGAHASATVRFTGDRIAFTRAIARQVERTADPGLTVFLDAGTLFPAPRLFVLAPDGITPETFLADPLGLLPAPVDLTFGLNGVIYVLDNEAGRPKVVAVDPATLSMSVVLQGNPLLFPSGICLAHDGALLIADPKTFDPVNSPGVIYRFDPETVEVTVFHSNSNPNLLRDPVDVCPDRQGHYLVTDYQSKASGGPNGAVFEIGQYGNLVTTYKAPALMVDPFSSAVRGDGSVLVTDVNPAGPSILRIQRPLGGAPSYSRVKGPDDTLLVKPYGIESVNDELLYVCDYESNPLHQNKGVVLAFSPSGGGQWDLRPQCFSRELHRPRRSATYALSRPTCTALTIEDASGGPLLAGDTLWVRAVVDNLALVPGVGVSGQFTFPAELHPIALLPGRGEMSANEEYGRVHWAGDLPFSYPDTLAVGFRVDSAAVHGRIAEIEFSLQGGEPGDPLSVRDTIAAALQGGEILVLDADADPFDLGHSGALFVADLAQEKLMPFRSDGAWVDPCDVLAAAPDQLLILDSEADPLHLGPPTGAIFGLDPTHNRSWVFSAGPDYKRPRRLLAYGDGSYLVLDPEAKLCPGAGRGLIFRVPAEGGSPRSFSCTAAYQLLDDMAVDPYGRLWISDMRANPKNLPVGNTGAIFCADLATGAVIDTIASEDLRDPQGLLWVDGEGLLLTDPSWLDQFGSTGIRQIDPETEEIRPFLFSPYMRTPTRLMQVSPEQILVADPTAMIPGATSIGAVFVIDLQLREIVGFLNDREAGRIQGLTGVPSPRAIIKRFSAREDTAGLWHASWDTLHCEFVAANPTPAAEPWVAIDLGVSGTVQIDVASVEVNHPGAEVEADRIRWSGALAGKDSLTIRYAATLALQPGLAAWGEQDVTLTAAVGDAAQRKLWHYISNETASGEMLVVDTWANPRNFSRSTGAVFRIQGPAREAVPVIADSIMVSPVAVRLIPGSATEMLIADADASPAGTGAGGCLLRASTRTGEVSVVFADPALVEPTAVVVVDSLTCFLLDSKADPLNLRPGSSDGPGAIYRVDLGTNTGELFFSDTLFTEPVDLAYNIQRGRLLVADRGPASGVAQHEGALFEFGLGDPTPLTLWSGAPLLSLRCATAGPSGTWLVLDGGESLGGSFHEILGMGNLVNYGRCDAPETPRDLLVDEGGALLIIDATANPGGFPTPTGSILRFDQYTSRCPLFRGGPPFVRPSGAAIRRDQTPVLEVVLEAVRSELGIALSWLAPAELSGADYYVYRRMPEDPTGTYELLNSESPLTGTGELHYLDTAVDDGVLYEYSLLALLPSGSRYQFGPASVRAGRPLTPFFLNVSAPNPFPLRSMPGGIAIRFGLPSASPKLRLAIYDVSGRLVCDLLRGPCPSGSHALTWNGRDRTGGLVGSGVYYLKLEASPRVSVHRMVLVR